MTREELKKHCQKQIDNCEMWAKVKGEEPSGKVYEEHKLILELLEQEPCEDAISREEAVTEINKYHMTSGVTHQCVWNECVGVIAKTIQELSPVTPQPKTGHCKDCKYFEYDSLARVDGVKLIFAHEICKRWGDGCKTKDDGYCFLFEPQESELENPFNDNRFGG